MAHVRLIHLRFAVPFLELTCRVLLCAPRPSCSLPGTALARTIATIGGFNWMLVDAEHGQITDGHYYEVRSSDRFS